MRILFAIFMALSCILSTNAIEYSFTSTTQGSYGLWTPCISKLPFPVKINKGAGFDNSDALVIENVGKKSFKIAIDNLHFVAGKQYRFGGYVKTKNLNIRRGRFVIHNTNWRQDISGRSFPANTNGKWVKFEYIAPMMPSSNGFYTFCAHIANPNSGSLELSKLYVEQVKEKDQLTPESYSFTAKTDPDSKSHDPNFTKLIDGISINDKTPHKARTNQFVLWRHKHNKGKGPVITFNFAQPVSIDKIKIHYFRWKNSYGIKEIRFTGINGDQRIAAGNLVLNHPYRKPDKDPFCDVAQIESATDQKFSSVEISFIPSGGWISLSEIEFFGKASAVKDSKPAKKKSSKVLKSSAKSSYTSHPLANELTTAAPAGLRMYKRNDMIVLENNQVIYVLNPGDSGTVNFAYDRESKTNMAIYNRKGTGFGSMFVDRLYPGNYDIRDMYRYVEYQSQIVADTPEKKQVRVYGIGKNGIFRNVVMSKLYTLTKDSPVLHVKHTISNGMDNVVPLRYGYWMCGGAQSANGYKFVIPGGNGVEVSPNVRQLTVRDISSGWLAAMDEKNDSALAVLMPYDLLKEFYFWTENKYHGTIEFKLGVYPIKAGESLSFDMGLCPISKIGIPSKITSFAALSFGQLPNKPQLNIRLFDTAGCTVKVSGGFLKKNNVQFKEIFTKAIAPGKKLFTSDFKLPTGTGTLVLKAELIRNNTVVMSTESSTIIGKSSGVWRVTPDCEKKPDINAGQAKANLNFNSLKVETPHIKWGKPSALKRPKVLSLNFRNGGIREIIELGQRFDLDITTNFTAGLWSLSGYVMSLSVKDCIAQLNDKLKKDYDVIIVSGNYWQHLNASIVEAILKKVENGTGLIVINPSAIPNQLKNFFSVGPRDRRGPVQWAAVKNENIFTGIPFEVMPKVRNFNYKTKGGKVLATAGNKPLITRFNYGKGKIFLAAYQGKAPRSSKSSTFILPSVIDDNPNLTYHYYEYHHMLLGKMIYAAANTANAIEVKSIKADTKNLVLNVISKQKENLNVEVTLRDKFSKVVNKVTHKTAVKKGSTLLTIPLGKATLYGEHFADTIISNNKGKVWWGTANFTNKTESYFTKAKITNKIYKQSDSIKPEIAVYGNGEIIYNLFDANGNCFAKGKGKSVALPLKDCLSATGALEILLVKNNKIVDKVIKEFDIFRKPDINSFQIAQGWPGVVDKAPLYLTDFYTKLLSDNYFVNSTSGSSVSWDNAAVARSYRKNNVLILSQEIGSGTGGKSPYNKNVKAKSKFELIRTPCLSDPQVLEHIKNSSLKTKGPAQYYGAILGAGADEANMFSNWDGCFCKHCLKDLRLYLKDSYTTLAALNKSWATNFKSWDEVIPMTLPEIRKHSSMAPWVDHRSFNDWQRARALGIQTAAINKNCKVFLSLSGTSDTNPWNAWDYSLIMPHMDAIAGYFGEQTIQHRSFAKGKLFSMPWIGYDVAYDEHNFQVIRALMNGVSGLNFYGTFYLNPDWTLPQAGIELKQIFNRYLNGKADAIMHFDAKVYPIAIHYSPASIKVDYVEGKNELRKSATAGFRNILQDNALNYNYISYGQIEKATFGQNKIIILPLSMALSEKEVKNLCQFVKNGGIVIADMGIGHFDNHGVPKKNRQDLLNLFGLSTFGKIDKVKGKVIGQSSTFNNLSIPVDFVEVGIKNRSAKVLAKAIGDFGSAPAILVNQYGKGKAIYIACDIAGTIGNQGALRYTKKHDKNTAQINNFFKELVASVKIQTIVTAPTLRSTELLLRENNNAYIVGFVRNIDQTKNSETKVTSHKISFNKKFYVWDLLEGKYLGYNKDFVYGFGPTTQSIWVALSYKPEALKAEVTKKGYHVKVTLSLVAKTNNFTRHIINVVVKDKKGNINKSYSKKLIMDKGKHTFEFNLPLNYPIDNWVIEAQDVFSSCKVVKAL